MKISIEVDNRKAQNAVTKELVVANTAYGFIP